MVSERRFFVDLNPRSLKPGSTVTLSPDDSHHLRDVLRLDVGESATLIDKRTGRRFHAKIIGCEPETALTIERELAVTPPQSRVKNLIYAFSKGDTLDLVLEKCTELGVERFILWQAERSVVRLTDRDLPKKLNRYEKIVESAAKQSNRSSIPEIVMLLNLKELFESHGHLIQASERSFVCSLTEGSKPVKELCDGKQANIVIGPEGGLTLDEERYLGAQGFTNVTLGSTVLRTETAAIAAVAILNAL